MTEQPGTARYPAVVALLRRERERAAEDKATFERRVIVAEEVLVGIRARAAPLATDPDGITWWEQHAAHYRDLIEQRESLVRQIDAALEALAGGSDDGE